MVFFTGVHIASHMVNFTRLALSSNTGFVGFLGANFLTGPGLTGWIMTLCLGLMVWFAIEKRRRARFEAFWYSHHLVRRARSTVAECAQFIIFFVNWQMHGVRRVWSCASDRSDVLYD